MKQFILIVFLLVTLYTSAQENRNVEFQVDLFNRHYWRGFVLGNSPSSIGLKKETNRK